MQTELESRPQAMIAMSGGVDSSVAAYLMQQAGYACMGATMRLYENEDAGLPRGSTCCALDDVEIWLDPYRAITNAGFYNRLIAARGGAHVIEGSFTDIPNDPQR